ncbi:MAG: tRNA (adenosine(37)-N6)-threonylcarbamoyltransferase complex ATPase subunit type 1 TsaE [Thermomicrobiales bacterium]|nr:tRNA (adenosine(37)-N6)-threonylcarbamoyltransferase complex ATPase subunit type 1 TsaE [Thermomicrobiales bacterium]
MNAESTIRTTSAEETRAAGASLAAQLVPGDVLLLHGDLGAGKTTLTQGLLAGLGVDAPVSSPTFVLVSDYAGHVASGEPVAIHHIDLYRLNEPSELDSTGYFDLIDETGGLLIVEWPERAASCLPERYVLVTIDFAGEDARTITIDDRSGRDRLMIETTD